MKYKIIQILFFFTLINFLSAQNGGKTVFNFLNHPTSARITALGSAAIPTREVDLGLAWTNPAVLNKDFSGQISFNHNVLFQGVGVSYLAYGKHVEKLNMTFHSGLQYVNFGSFAGTDETGKESGDFNASDMAFGIGASRPLSEKWNLGMNLKFISSNLESYSSTGLSSDVSAMYFHQDRKLGFVFLVKNAGAQLSNYHAAAERGALPFEIQMGLTKQLKHLPFRFSFIAKDLQRWNITYKDPNIVETNFDGTTKEEAPAIVRQLDNLARHLGVNGEFLLGKRENLRLRFGYNHLLKKELSVSPYRSLTGFSFGLGFKVSKFRIDFGRSVQHLAGGFSHFSFITNFKEFRKK